jgi:hypothetical protein
MPAKKKIQKVKSQNLVLYVENSTPNMKLFSDPKKAIKFADKFTKDNPNPMDGYWVDFVITDIRGEIIPMEFNGVDEQA